MRVRFLVGARLVLGLVVGAVAVLGGGSAASANPAVVKQKAVKFAKSGWVDLIEVADGTFSGIRGLGQYKDKATGDDYVWDINGGFVRRYSNSAAYEGRGRGAVIGQGQARKIAQEWLDRVYEGASPEAMKVTCTLREEGDEGFAEWEVDFRHVVGDVPTFDHLTVVLDAVTGQTLFVEQEYGVLTEDTTPKVARERAVAVAAELLRLPESCCTTAHLEVVRRVDGEQILVWVCRFVTGDAEFGGTAEVVVDAHTGAVVDYGKSW